MADVHSPEIRSFNMSRIRGKNTRPEILVRKFLFSQGYRYRIHVDTLPGKPDIVLRRFNTVIFVHGCFWHGHEGCRYFVVPKTRTDWWLAKIQRNKTLDKEAKEKLEKTGWNVQVVFECELRKTTFTTTLDTLHNFLKTHDTQH